MRTGHISIAQFAEATWWLARYRLGDAKIEDAIRRSVRTLAGTYESDLERRCERFNREWVLPRVRPGARNAIAAHLAKGDHLCLLTSASNYIADPLARELGVQGVICNRFETDESGVFTGRAFEPLCFGPGKLELARDYAHQHSLAIKDAVFYTDSYSDLPVLEAVADPVLVHPDPRLAALGARRGWTRVAWGRTAE